MEEGVRFFMRNGVNCKLRDDYLMTIVNLCLLKLKNQYLGQEGTYSQHHSDVIMSAMTSQITSVSVVYSNVCSGADQRKHQSSASLAFVRGFYRWPVNSPHKGSVTRTKIPFDDVIMANWRSPSVTVSFTCAQNVVFQRKINFCVDVERIVYFPYVWLCFICFLFKITHIHIRFVCVYLEFTLLSSTWWTQNGFKSARREDENFLNTRWHQFAGLIAVVCRPPNTDIKLLLMLWGLC